MNRITKDIVLGFVLVVFVLVFTSASVVADEQDTMSAFQVGKKNSGHHIEFPGFIEIQEVRGVDLNSDNKLPFAFPTYTLETPNVEDKTDILLFNFATTNPDAHSVYVSVASQFSHLFTIQLMNMREELKDGKVSVNYPISQAELKHGSFKTFTEKELMFVYIMVYDKSGEMIDDVSGVKFMYEPFINIYKKNLPETAKPTSSKVIVNEEEVSFQAYNISGNNYFKLRDLAMAIDGTDKSFAVGWDAVNNAISLESGQDYTEMGGELEISDDRSSKIARMSSSNVFVDGTYVGLTKYNIDNNNYFNLRDIARVFNIGVTWDGGTNTVGIDTSLDYEE